MEKEGKFKKKKVLVMGLGLHGGGVEIVRFLAKQKAILTVTDLRSKKVLDPSLRQLREFKNIRYVLGRHREKDFLNSDLIVKNPGVPPDSPYLKLARKQGVGVTSDLGIFFKNFKGVVIGITGTRGKSTTAYLIWKFLKIKKRRVFLAGNIRKSVLEILPFLNEKDAVVLELSSFQLKDLEPEKVSPRIAVITNVFPDHLNWHKNFRDYINAKSIIFKFQKPRDLLYINSHDRAVRSISRKARSKVEKVVLPKQLVNVVDKNLGEHYRTSAALAVKVAVDLGVPLKSIEKALKSFKGLEGRQEILPRVKGRNFVNDTTSTIPEATIAAIRRFKKAAGKHEIILIVGGQNKKLDFRKLADVIKKRINFVVMLPGTATDKLKKFLPKDAGLRVYKAFSMKNAVRISYELSGKGDWILLSPGAASFGLFLNEFDRGKKFIEAINFLR